jgi:hypothetical protein
MKTGATLNIDHNDVDCQGKLIQNKLIAIDQFVGRMLRFAFSFFETRLLV